MVIIGWSVEQFWIYRLPLGRFQLVRRAIQFTESPFSAKVTLRLAVDLDLGNAFLSAETSMIHWKMDLSLRFRQNVLIKSSPMASAQLNMQIELLDILIYFIHLKRVPRFGRFGWLSVRVPHKALCQFYSLKVILAKNRLAATSTQPSDCEACQTVAELSHWLRLLKFVVPSLGFGGSNDLKLLVRRLCGQTHSSAFGKGDE